MNSKENIIIANNPQTFMNTFQSGFRNSVITCTLGIAMYGFSTGFTNKRSEFIMRLMSLIMYLYSITLCLVTTFMLRDYVKKLKKIDKNKLPKYIQVKYWEMYTYLGFGFCGILGILIILASKRFILRILGFKNF